MLYKRFVFAGMCAIIFHPLDVVGHNFKWVKITAHIPVSANHL